MTELKPCPFCGCSRIDRHVGSRDGWYWTEIRCTDCGATVGARGWSTDSIWNRRVKG